MNFNKIILILCFGLFVQSVFAQAPTVSLYIDKDSITIGEVIQLEAIVEYRSSGNVKNSGLDEMPKNDSWEMIGRVILSKDDTIDTKGNLILLIKEKFEALVFLDEGLLTFPPVTYQVAYRDSTYSITSNPVSVYVKPVVGEDELPSGLKTIIEEKKIFSDYFPWIMGVVGLALAVWLFLYLRNREPRDKEKPIPKPPKMTPEEKATKALIKLRKEKRWEGDPKGNQVKLSQIIRWYLEHEFNIPALENTTGEIDGALKKYLSPTQRNGLIKLLNDSDMVKFAKLTMPDERQDESIKDAISWVKNNSF